MSRNTFSFADHAWLRMDDTSNLMIITGLMTFSTPLDTERFIAIIEEKFLDFSRFRQRVSPPLISIMRPAWEDDPDFRLERHIEELDLPDGAEQADLQELIGVIMSIPLDYAHPLWKFYIFQNYLGGSALVARLHHSIADGIALMQVLLSMTTTSADGEPESEQGGAELEAGTIKADVLTGRRIRPVDIWEEGRQLFLYREHALHRARQAVSLAEAVARLALRWPDPQTIFKGPLQVEKRCVWSQPYVLEDVKKISKRFGATINDVLLSSVAGALGQYLVYRSESRSGINIRGLVPINLRPVKLDEELGNKFGLLFLSLPVGIEDPVERLRRVKRTMDGLKSSAEPVATFGILSLIGGVPDWAEELAIDFFDTKGSAVMTNVPGPKTQLFLAGAPIDTLMAWVPQSGRIALGVSIISYNGKVWLGVTTDAGLAPDPEKIVEFFDHEFVALESVAAERAGMGKNEIQDLIAKMDETIRALDEREDRGGGPPTSNLETQPSHEEAE